MRRTLSCEAPPLDTMAWEVRSAVAWLGLKTLHSANHSGSEAVHTGFQHHFVTVRRFWWVTEVRANWNQLPFARFTPVPHRVALLYSSQAFSVPWFPAERNPGRVKRRRGGWSGQGGEEGKRSKSRINGGMHKIPCLTPIGDSSRFVTDCYYVQTRDLLAVKTKSSFVSWLAKLQ